MRKKPTPSSLGLTKSTCMNHDRPSGHQWFKVYFGADNFWYSNGHVALDQSPGRICKGAEDLIWHGAPSKGYDAARIIPAETGDTLRIGNEVEHGHGEFGMQGVELHGWRRGHGYLVTVQTKYLELVKWLYPEATLEGYNSTSAVKVVEDGKLVAVVMPYRP